MILQFIERDLLGAMHRAVLEHDCAEFEIDNRGEVRRWVRVPRSHPGFPGFWRAPAADLAADARACLMAAAFPPRKVPERSDEPKKRPGRKRAQAVA